MLTSFGRAVVIPARLRADAARPVPEYRNGLLRALPPDVIAALHPRLQAVDLKRRQVLYERNVPLQYAYFIEHGAASLHLRIGGRGTLEVGLLGRIDLAGVPLVLSTGRTPHRCLVQVPGSALRIGADDLQQAMEELPRLREVLMGYVQARMMEMAQLAACNTCHTLQQRLARCLLMMRDRIEDDEIPITHQALSRALGVRRAGVTTAMGRMEEVGLLHRGRGRLVIVDRAGLEAEACECYRATRSEYQRFVCTAAEDGAARQSDRGAVPELLAS